MGRSSGERLMLSGNYWDKVVRNRISRRRAIQGAAGLGLSAAALGLIGCGGGDDDDSESTGGSGASGLLHNPSVSTGKAGGVLKHSTSATLRISMPLPTPMPPSCASLRRCSTRVSCA